MTSNDIYSEWLKSEMNYFKQGKHACFMSPFISVFVLLTVKTPALSMRPLPLYLILLPTSSENFMIGFFFFFSLSAEGLLHSYLLCWLIVFQYLFLKLQNTDAKPIILAIISYIIIISDWWCLLIEGVLRFSWDWGAMLNPQNPYSFLKVILSEKSTYFYRFKKIICPFF